MSSTNTLASQLQADDTAITGALASLTAAITAETTQMQTTLSDLQALIASQAGTVPANVLSDLNGFAAQLSTSVANIQAGTASLQSADPGAAAPAAPAPASAATPASKT